MENFTLTLTLIFDALQIQPSHNYLYVRIDAMMDDFQQKFSTYLLGYILTDGRDDAFQDFAEVANVFRQQYIDASEVQALYNDYLSDRTVEKQRIYTEAKNNFQNTYNENYSNFIARVDAINSSGIFSYYNAGINFCQNFIWNGSHCDSSLWDEQFWQDLAKILWKWE